MSIKAIGIYVNQFVITSELGRDFIDNDEHIIHIPSSYKGTSWTLVLCTLSLWMHAWRGWICDLGGDVLQVDDCVIRPLIGRDFVRIGDEEE